MKLVVDSTEVTVVAFVVSGLWVAAGVYRKILDVMGEFQDLRIERQSLSSRIDELEREVARREEACGSQPDLPPVVETFDYRTTPSSKE